ncbi:MAG: SDR family oxidoreductase [Candidatus Dadabacteria bacterium]|nr:MAG: SDR family oxidoreductase [Candidatus Dadabacteria bacterium]
MKAAHPFGPRGWTPERLGDLTGKTYLITGTTSGTGFEAARLLLSRGARLLMLNRNPQKSADTVDRLKQEYGDSADVSSITMDLAVLDSVRKAAAEVLGQTDRIDALIGNAAIAQVPELRLTVDGFESQLGVNYFSYFLLCGLLYDRIAQSGGRIVLVSSLAYKMGPRRIQFEDLNFERNYSPRHAYSQSKLALMMFAYELQRRSDKVPVYVCHPGASRTNLIATSGSRFDRIIWSIASRIIAQSAEKGAWPEVMCATEDGLKQQALYGPTRRAETVGPVGEGRLDPCALDREAARKLWDISEQKTGFRWNLPAAT